MWKMVGRLLFYVTWPGSWLYLHKTQRTRIILVADDNVLVVHNWLSTNRWSFPGGGIGRHEPSSEGAKRELKEEVGLDVGELKFIGSQLSHSRGFRYTFHVFVGQANPSQPLRLRKPEINDAAWLPIDSLNHANADSDTLGALGAFASAR